MATVDYALKIGLLSKGWLNRVRRSERVICNGCNGRSRIDHSGRSAQNVHQNVNVLQ